MAGVRCRVSRVAFRAGRRLLHCVRDFRRSKRDVSCERSIVAACDESSARLKSWLAAEQSSPSQRVERMEEVLRLAEAVAALPEGQREVVVLYYWQGCSLAEIGEHLERSISAVAGLLQRGLGQLRRRLSENERR